MSSNQRQFPRTPMKCRIRISHDSLGNVFAQTRDLSDGGVYIYIKHAELATLKPGMVVSGQVQDLPIPAPELELEVVRVDTDGAGFRFVGRD